MADCLLWYCYVLHVGWVLPSCTPLIIILIFLTARHIHNKWKWWKIATKISPKSPKYSLIAPSTKRQ